MPVPRVMGDMLILPTAEVLIINGAKFGTAGWGVARQPVLEPVLYNPGFRRFQTMAATTIPRLYHSTAIVLPDGKVLVAGSNPNPGYSFAGVLNPTELRIEKYSPYYLYKGYDFRRPHIVSVAANVKYGSAFQVSFKVATPVTNVAFHLYAPPFVTHTYSMNQRMLILGTRARPSRRVVVCMFRLLLRLRMASLHPLGTTCCRPSMAVLLVLPHGSMLVRNVLALLSTEGRRRRPCSSPSHHTPA